MVPFQTTANGGPHTSSGYQPPVAPNPLQNTVANAYNTAVMGTGRAMNLGFNPMMAQTSYATGVPATAQGYNAFTGLDAQGNPLAGYAGSAASGGGYEATHMGPVRDVMAGQFAGTDIAPYMNPYLSNVVDQTAADMERARLIEQNATNDAMTAAGAFGGSRHGIANAETNRGFYDRLGATMGQLRNLGFETARDSAFRDIANRMQADLANQGMDFNVGSFNAGASNEAARTGANNATAASIANANNSAALAGQRLGAVNEARRFGANAFNENSRFNSQLGAALSQFNAENENATSQFNANAYNTGAQRFFDNQMNAAAQMGNLSNLGFGMANTMTDRQAADGAAARATQQAIIDAAMRQFAGYTGAGNAGLGMLQSGVAAAPGAQNTTSTSNPGLLGLFGAFA